MSELAIRVEHLGKQYRLGGQQARYSTFRETLVDTVNAPLRWLKGEHRVEQNSFWALDDVSFEVKQGEAVGIIGRNGAGKSTLLKILSRITSPTRGRVDIYGRVGSLLEVGTGFHPELTGRENIFLNGAILGMSRVEISRKFDEIVDFSGIEKFLDTPVKHYSSGMYVRLAFAVAAHLEPEILVVDEVLAVGDAEFQKKCLGKMEDVTHEGRTVMFVSHNMGVIEILCQKSILVDAGLLSFIGDTKEAVKHYLSSTNRIVETPIALRRDRKGTGKLTFDDIIVDNSQIYDRILQVELSIRNHSKEQFKNIHLSIVINDHMGRSLANIINLNIDAPISIGVNGARARIIISNINLVPGNYCISPFVSSDIHNGEIYDWIFNAVNFVIPEYDYYHLGRMPQFPGELIYFDYKYEIINIHH
jgi:lipopolysaccharide transport system ATP-binding protein